jgi:hypothetical protein
MSIPTWVRFSLVNIPIRFLFENIGPLLRRYEFKLRQVAQLKWSLEKNELEFDEESIIDIDDISEVYEITSKWDGFALAYTVFSVGVYMYLYFWKTEGITCLAIETDTQTPYLETDQLVKGEWLEKFLCEYTSLCGTKVCVYGHYYSIEYKPISTEEILANLKNGDLLTKEPGLSFYMISATLLSEEEVALLLDSNRKHNKLYYFQTTTKYHIFSSLQPDKISF